MSDSVFENFGNWKSMDCIEAARKACPQFKNREELAAQPSSCVHAKIGFPIATTTLDEMRRQLLEAARLGWTSAGSEEKMINGKRWVIFGLRRTVGETEITADMNLEFMAWPWTEFTKEKLAKAEREENRMVFWEYKTIQISGHGETRSFRWDAEAGCYVLGALRELEIGCWEKIL